MALMTPGGHGLGRLADLGDIRDFAFVAPSVAALPPSVDLRAAMPPIGDQGHVGSCTAWASTAAYRYELDRQKLPDFEPSELAQYWWTRYLDGTTGEDAGGSLRNAVKVLSKYGAAPESVWPYEDTLEAVVKKPTTAVSRSAKKHLALQYRAVPQTLPAIKGALAEGLPVLLGISVYQSFESAPVVHTGVVPMPGHQDALLGGHALLLVGYDDARSVFITRNSWGVDFGEGGYIFLPYQYVTNPKLASDMWVVSSVE